MRPNALPQQHLWVITKNDPMMDMVMSDHKVSGLTFTKSVDSDRDHPNI